VTDADIIAELGQELRGTGARIYFDIGNDSTKPCTFCGTRPAPTHKVIRLGTFANGEPIRRPCCAQCLPIAEAKAKAPTTALSTKREQVIEMLRQQAESLTEAAALLATEEVAHG
jgi:hypothetical protein